MLSANMLGKASVIYCVCKTVSEYAFCPMWCSRRTKSGVQTYRSRTLLFLHTLTMIWCEKPEYLLIKVQWGIQLPVGLCRMWSSMLHTSNSHSVLLPFPLLYTLEGSWALNICLATSSILILLLTWRYLMILHNFNLVTILAVTLSLKAQIE